MMRPERTALGVIAVWLVLSAIACPVAAQQKTPAKPAAKPAAKAESASAAADTTDPLEYARPEVAYDASGRRDPFESLVPETINPEETIKGEFDYEEASIKGIVVTGNDRYALVVDGDNYSYVLREGYRVLGGVVTGISPDAVQFNIVKYGRALRITMRLTSSRNTMIEENERSGSTMLRPGIVVQYRQGATEGERVLIEDVLAPPLGTRLVEDEWFGTQDDTPFLPEGEEAKTDRGPEPVVPADGVTIGLPLLLDWTAVAGEDVQYTVQVDDSADFSSPIMERSGLESTSLLVDSKNGLPAGKLLYWRVSARLADGREIPGRLAETFRIR